MSLRFEDERYVRLFTRDTTNWVVGPWQARAVLPLVLRKLDRAGTLDLGDEGLEALAALVLLPIDVVQAGMAFWLRKGTFELAEGRLVMPLFLEAQEATASDAKRSRERRERARDLARRLPAPDTKRDARDTDPAPMPERGQLDEHEREPRPDTSRVGGDTKRDGATRAVSEATRGDTPSRTVPSLLTRAGPPGSPPSPSLRSGDPPPRVRTSDAHGTRLLPEWRPSEATMQRFAAEGVDALGSLESFANHWIAKSGKDARKLDWDRTFINWVREDMRRGRAAMLPPPELVAPPLPLGDPAQAAKVADIVGSLARAKRPHDAGTAGGPRG